MFVFFSIQVRDEIERRPIHNDRQNINETIRRLAKPKNSTMTQSIHAGATKTAKTLPISRSSHQLRMTASSIATTTTTNRRVKAKAIEFERIKSRLICFFNSNHRHVQQLCQLR